MQKLIKETLTGVGQIFLQENGLVGLGYRDCDVL